MSGVLKARYRRNSSINESQSFLETRRRSKLDPGHSEVDYVEVVKNLTKTTQDPSQAKHPKQQMNTQTTPLPPSHRIGGAEATATTAKGDLCENHATTGQLASPHGQS